MTKKIQTIQLSDKNSFDEKVNLFLELGYKLMDGGYNVITDKDKVLYTQVVVIDTKKYEVRFHNNGQIEYTVPLNKNGERHGRCFCVSKNGNISNSTEYDNGLMDGQVIHYYDDGSIKSSSTWEDGYLDGSCGRYLKDGTTLVEGTYKNEEPYNGSFYYYNPPDTPFPTISVYKNGEKIEEVEDQRWLENEKPSL